MTWEKAIYYSNCHAFLFTGSTWTSKKDKLMKDTIECGLFHEWS